MVAVVTVEGTILSVSTAMVLATSQEIAQKVIRDVVVTVTEETHPVIEMVGDPKKNALTVTKLVT